MENAFIPTATHVDALSSITFPKHNLSMTSNTRVEAVRIRMFQFLVHHSRSIPNNIKQYQTIRSGKSTIARNMFAPCGGCSKLWFPKTAPFATALSLPFRAPESGQRIMMSSCACFVIKWYINSSIQTFRETLRFRSLSLLR